MRIGGIVTVNDMRYRIENGEGKAWDSIDNRWKSLLIGYTTYKTEKQAIAYGRRIKHPMFQAYPDKKVVRDMNS